jgi:ATP phosphoribosyltransferase regulatory subunit
MRNDSKSVPEGVADIHSFDLELKESLIDSLKALYRGYGYRQVQTPVFEYYDLFLEIKETIDKEKMVKLIDRDGKILVLRPDATIPIARMVATNQNGESSYKLSYFTNVFRMSDNTQNLSNRELTQAGIEFFGRQDYEADVEVISLAIQSLQQLGVSDFQIDLGQANYFKELLNATSLSISEQSEIRKAIEQKNVSELRKVLSETMLEETYQNAILSIPLLYGNPSEVLEKAKKLSVNDEMNGELEHLSQVYSRLVEDGFEEYLSVDLGMINDLNYYTGIIFQGYIKGLGKTVVVGGRYDQLTKQFGSELPATGFGIYLDNLLEFFKSIKLDTKISSQTIVVAYEEKNRKKAIQVADTLRKKHFIVESTIFDQRRLEVPYVLLSDEAIEVIEEGNSKMTYNSVNELLEYLNR